MDDETEPRGIRGFLRDVFLDPEDVEHERRFDMRSLPLAVMALAAGFAYSRTGMSWLAVLAAVCMTVYAIYFAVNRAAYVIRLVRGRSVLGCRTRANGSGPSPAWVRWLERAADDDTVYALIGGYGVPIVGSVLVAVWSVTGWSWLWWLIGVLAITYAAYWLMMLFVRTNRRLSGLLHDRETRLDEARRRMERMRRDRELAGRTHDTVAGGLSYIAFLAQQHMENPDIDDTERDVWRQIDHAAQRTLDNVHQVINVLDGSNPVSERFESPMVLIEERVDTGASHIRALGFNGTMSVNLDGLADIPVEETTLQETADLIDELFVNIAAHADPSKPYALDISMRSGRLRVVQTNIAVDGKRFHRARSGRGLGLHRRRIEALGGTLNTSLEDGEWTLYAELPLYDNAAAETGRKDDL